MLRFQDYILLIEKINAGKNIHLWGDALSPKNWAGLLPHVNVGASGSIKPSLPNFLRVRPRKQGIGKTFTVRNCLLKDINLESVYLNLEYPFSVDNLFDVIPISLGLYYQQNWSNIVSQLSDGFQKLLVIDNFDRLHSVSETLSDDLFRLQQLAKLDNFSLLLISRMPLRYFHFPSFAKCFEELELNENNTWTFGQ